MNTLSFDYARRLDLLISAAQNSSASDISLNVNNTDEIIRSGNVVGIEIIANDFANYQIAGNPIITPADLLKVTINLRYEGDRDLVLKMPANRLKMGQLDTLYRPLEFMKNTRIDVGRSTITINTALTVAPCAIGFMFYLRNITKY